MIKSDAPIYKELERILKAAGDTPMTCVEIWDAIQHKSRFEDTAKNPNDISNYLGHMWRRDIVQRWYASKESSSRARYSYTWKEKADKLTPVPSLSLVQSTADTSTLGKPNITVSEDDGTVTIDLNEFTITVRRK